jgi:hypothetical protein
MSDISQEQAVEATQKDAKGVSIDLSPYRSEAVLKDDGWHIGYLAKKGNVVQGGPSYLVNRQTAKILGKQYVSWDQALSIACKEVDTISRGLSQRCRNRVYLEKDGWHVEFVPLDADNSKIELQCLIEPVSGKVLSRQSKPEPLPESIKAKTPEKEGITSDQALKAARSDAENAYRDLSPYQADVVAGKDGWHVDFQLKDPESEGGGPHYVIDRREEKILAKKYEQ